MLLAHELDSVWKMGFWFLASHADKKGNSVLPEQCLLVASCDESPKAAEKKKQLRKLPQVNWKRDASVEMWYFPIINVLSPSHNSRIKFIFHKIRYVFLSWTEDSKTMLAFISKQRGNASSEESVSQWRYFVSKDKFFSVYKHCYTICNIILFILWLFAY